MRDKIKARIKAKYSDANLSNARMDEISDRLAAKITDENQIDERLDAMNDVVPFADIAKQDDKLRNLEAKNKPTLEPNPQPQPNPQPAPAPEDMPAWAKTLLGEVQTLKADKQAQTIQQQLAGHAKLKTIPAQFWNKRALPTDPAQIDAFVDEVEADHTAFKQTLVDQGFAAAAPPVGGTPAGTDASVKADIAAWAGTAKS